MVLINKKPNQSAGFSLLESIVTIGIAVFVFLIIALVFIAHNKLFNLQSILADSEINNYLALNHLGKLIKSSNRVLASQTINSINYSSSANVLVLELPSVDSSQNIIPNSFDYAAIHQSSTDQTKLIVSLQANSPSSRASGNILISSGVQKIIFSYNNSDFTKVNLVSIYLTNARTFLGARPTTNSSVQFALRNF